MKITRVAITNYRSIEFIELTFPSYYAALCGKNDAGKTNVLRAIRYLLRETNPYGFTDNDCPSVKEDFPNWKNDDNKDREIGIQLGLEVYPDSDEGLYKFLSTYLVIDGGNMPLGLVLYANYSNENEEGQYKLEVNGNQYDEMKAQEVLNRLQSSGGILFHNSTESDQRYRFPKQYGGLMRELAVTDSEGIDKLMQQVDNAFSKIALKHQEELSDLLGKLSEKYSVGLTLPKFNIDFLPFTITLGDKGSKVSLNDWGSGTQNRTRILLTLFQARRTSEAVTSASKTTPIMIVEEPESFLHPSAQAEFGRVLQDLAEEFKVQVIVTTHSPYMLSQARPESNILLQRVADTGNTKRTVRVDTDGDNWMEPFGLALGIDNAEFRPWKDVLFGTAESMLMVEGDIDKEFFEMLRSEEHVDNRLQFNGEIFPYGGKDILKNSVLVKFIKNRFNHVFITYDLDAEESVSRCLTSLGLQKNKDYCAIGLDEAGKRAIEGLLPETITKEVYANNPALVMQALHGTPEEQRSAKGRLKRFMIDEFKSTAKPGVEYYGQFYTLVESINSAFRS